MTMTSVLCGAVGCANDFKTGYRLIVGSHSREILRIFFGRNYLAEYFATLIGRGGWHYGFWQG